VSTTPGSTSTAPTSTAPSGGCTTALYGQCGGIGALFSLVTSLCCGLTFILPFFRLDWLHHLRRGLNLQGVEQLLQPMSVISSHRTESLLSGVYYCRLYFALPKHMHALKYQTWVRVPKTPLDSFTIRVWTLHKKFSSTPLERCCNLDGDRVC
jgi:hypothetical protein